MLAPTIRLAYQPKVEAIVDIQSVEKCFEGGHVVRVETGHGMARRRAQVRVVGRPVVVGALRRSQAS